MRLQRTTIRNLFVINSLLLFLITIRFVAKDQTVELRHENHLRGTRKTEFVDRYDCGNVNISIFVYPIPPHLKVFHGLNCEPMGGMFDTENIFLPTLKSHCPHVFTNDPSSATLFFIDHCAVAMTHKLLYHRNFTYLEARKEVEDSYLTPIIDQVLHVYPYYNSSHGIPGHAHAMLQVSGNTRCQFPKLFSSTGYFNDIIFIQHVGSLGKFCKKDCFNPDLDIVIPGMTTTRWNPDESSNFSMAKRKWLAFFAGTFLLDNPSYSNGVRQSLWNHYGSGFNHSVQSNTSTKPQDIVLIDGHIQNYSQSLQSSLFGLSPSGWAPYSPRTIDSLLCGAIPVIISDDHVPPFFRTIPWNDISVNIREHDIPKLDKILKEIVANTSMLESYQVKLKDAAIKVSWDDANVDGVLSSILLELDLVIREFDVTYEKVYWDGEKVLWTEQ